MLRSICWPRHFQFNSVPAWRHTRLGNQFNRLRLCLPKARDIRKSTHPTLGVFLSSVLVWTRWPDRQDRFMTGKTVHQEADLPKAVLKRLIKSKLQEYDKSRGGDGTRDFQINKDALLAFGEASKLFIHYLTSMANDVCKDAKRQTVNADDVFKALADMEFEELVPSLKEALEAFKTETREKNKQKAEASKKRKAEAAQPGPSQEEQPPEGDQEGNDGRDEPREAPGPQEAGLTNDEVHQPAQNANEHGHEGKDQAEDDNQAKKAPDENLQPHDEAPAPEKMVEDLGKQGDEPLPMHMGVE